MVIKKKEDEITLHFQNGSKTENPCQKTVKKPWTTPEPDNHPRLLYDNGSCYISGDLKETLEEEYIKHVRGKPSHPQTQGKIERYHRSMKNIIRLENYDSPEQLEAEIAVFVEYYNNRTPN